MTRSQPFFRYSNADALLALCGVGNVVLLFWTFLSFPTLSWLVLVPAFCVVAWFYCWNLQCISHNFIHNPFFSNVWLNRAFGVLESVALGVPHLLYHHYHLNHHWGDSDRKGSDGTTRDWSSIYRYGKGDAPEGFWRYVLLSFWRVEVGAVVRTVARHGRGEMVQLAVETLVLGAFWLTLLLVDWRYLLFFYLPSYYLGWMLSYAEGYFEHHRCQPGNPYANSVSSYHKLYNWLWFNNGYHQEHHWDPKRHWTAMPQLHEEIKPQLMANGTRILRGPHMTSFLEDWLNASQRPAAADTKQQRAAA